LETKDLSEKEPLGSKTVLADRITRKPLSSNESSGLALGEPLDGHNDPFACLKDPSLKLKPKADDFPELPDFLRRGSGQFK
jgi:hypothetical protein